MRKWMYEKGGGDENESVTHPNSVDKQMNPKILRMLIRYCTPTVVAVGFRYIGTYIYMAWKFGRACRC